MTSIAHRLKALPRSQRVFDVDVRDTYFALRFGTGLIGAILPMVLVGWGLAHHIAWNEMGSLSAFYWLSLSPPADANALLRNWFVGSLAAVGICLIIYRGYGRLENWLLNFAGLAALVVALNPMPWPSLHADPLQLHYAAAVVFFLLIAATIWFCARDTLAAVGDAKQRARWDLAYRMLAIAMVLLPVLALVLATQSHRTIYVETLGVWVFSSYWFIKTYELLRISMLEPASGPAPRVRRVNGALEITR